MALLCAAACDRQSPPVEQAPANTVAAAPALKEAGQLDRSHKGEAAPALAFKTPEGTDTTLAAFKGKPVLVNLWATWCAPCKAEMPTLDALAVRDAGKLTVLTISQDLQGAESVTPYFSAQGFKALKPYLDTEMQFSMAFAATLPMTILYDAEGRELWRMTGGMDWTGSKAAALIAEAG